MSELTLLKVYDWWKINCLWLEKYIKADTNTSWGEEDKAMIETITRLIEKGMELFPEDWNDAERGIGPKA